MTDKTNTNRIEKQVTMQAPPARVWKSLTDAKEFGTWFRAELGGEFAVGRTIQARSTYPGYEHVKFEMTIERMQPERLFSFRWHPHAVDPKLDYSGEPTTLVEFRLEPEGRDGKATRLTVVESGFDRLPPHRRDLAFRMNSEGWAIQLGNVRDHVAR